MMCLIFVLFYFIGFLRKIVLNNEWLHVFNYTLGGNVQLEQDVIDCLIFKKSGTTKLISNQ